VKVIPIAGLSGSGKTTFIRALIPLLARIGPVGTVKHTGHHSMELPEGKDTTVMFSAGAAAVAGVDREKTLVTLHGSSLAGALDILSGQGISFAVVEGYKSSPLPKIVIGDIDLEGCVLRNPGPGEVIRVLDRFPDYFTLGGILRELGNGCQPGDEPVSIAASAIRLPPEPDEKTFMAFERLLPRIVGSAQDLPGVISARAAVQKGVPFGRPNELLVGVAGRGAEGAAAGMVRIVSGCKREMETSDISIT